MNDGSPVIEMLAVETLRPAARNARTHSDRQIRQIAKSIEEYGFTNPILIDDDNGIVAGHGRHRAARELGVKQVPCLRMSGMSPAKKRAYILADNKLALNAGWDQELLALELGELGELDFDLSLTGFDIEEIDFILTDASESSVQTIGKEDQHPEPESAQAAVTRCGDLWILGRHRLLCGDAKDGHDVDRLMDGEKADMAFTDPPYNVPIMGHVGGSGRTRHREFVEASGELSQADFTTFLTLSLENIERSCRSGAIVYVCMDWRHLREVLAAGYAVFEELKNTCVWTKTNGGMGSFYRSQHEMVLVWKVGDAPHTNTFGLGDKGRYRTNVWSYAGVNSFRTDRMEELVSHPTVKPVALVADAIRDVSHRGQLVLDTFGGSGTTLMAAQKTGRRARLMELDPVYCDVIIRRWEKCTGQQAVHQANAQTFEQVAADRIEAIADEAVS